MSKPIAKRVPSDDCEVEIDGTEYALHAGEWIDVKSGLRVADLRVFRCLTELKPKFDALEGDVDGGDEEAQKQRMAMQQALLLDGTYQEAVVALSKRITAWNWTDDDGQALPQPANKPEAFSSLRVEEVLYLVSAIQGQAPSEQKNGSRPSPTSSSATRRQLSQV